MSDPSPAPPAPRRRRMDPDVRRQEILDVARRLFSERPYSEVSTGDIAEAAGVARSLVHRYLGGVRDVFLAVIIQGANAVGEARMAGPETPFEERTASNVAAALDVIAAHRETWLAVVGLGAHTGDPEIAAMILAAQERLVDQTLTANRDILEDTPTTRFALRCSGEMNREAIRAWLEGERTREETEALVLTAGRDLMRHTIPALVAASSPGD